MPGPSDTLKSRTYLGLLLAQFTATFNDQAIHMVAIFFASDLLVRFVGVRLIDEKGVVALVTACFITPFLIFSPLAGLLADRFSKRSIIVFWKVAEVIFMLIALVGLSLPHAIAAGWGDPHTLALWSAVLTILAVFLMGLHSTFFVPAKYGAMPEILSAKVLSRGNGLLEGTSFMAQILGTSAGGILYTLFKSHVESGRIVPGQEWLIGLLLLVLASVGTLTAFVMQPIPAAAPNRPLSWSWWAPLRENLTIVWSSKPLTVAITGIAFAAFMTLFIRQTLLYEAEIKKEIDSVRQQVLVSGRPADSLLDLNADDSGHRTHWTRVYTSKLRTAAQQAELRVSLLIALVGFGVGLGSILAGYLSGERLELGLVPVGSGLLVVLLGALAAWMHSARAVTLLLFSVGIVAGLYIVPLYTLMQQRAPKQSKGNVVAASNFLNVAGGILAVLLFYSLAFGLERVFGPSLSLHDLDVRPELAPVLAEQLQYSLRIPRTLYVLICLMTATAVVLLYQRLPDFVLRTAVWLRAGMRNRLRLQGQEHLPSAGPAVLVMSCGEFDGALQVLAATDRFTRVILVEDATQPRETGLWKLFARLSGMFLLHTDTATPADWDAARHRGLKTLKRGDQVAVSVGDASSRATISALIDAWRGTPGVQLIPVGLPAGLKPADLPLSSLRIGCPLPATTSWDELQTAVQDLVGPTPPRATAPERVSA